MISNKFEISLVAEEEADRSYSLIEDQTWDWFTTGMLIEPGISYYFEMIGRQNEDSSHAKEPLVLGVPEEIAASLCECGGIEGLVKLLPSDAHLEKLGARHRACADPIRLKILAMLGVQPFCVCVIKAVIGIADSKLSYHLGVLKKAGLIEGEQQGSWIVYSLTGQGRTCNLQ